MALPFFWLLIQDRGQHQQGLWGTVKQRMGNQLWLQKSALFLSPPTLTSSPSIISMTETQFSELHACRLTQVFSGHSDILISVILLSVNFHNIFLHVFLCLFVLFQFLVPGIESRASWMMLRHPTTELEHHLCFLKFTLLSHAYV